MAWTMSARAGGSRADASAGRPPIEQRDPTLRADLEALIEPTTRGDPESPLRWTTRSVRNLAAELQRSGHTVSHQTVSELLHDLGYSLQANRKVLEGTAHPDRDAQFRHISEAVQLQVTLGEPVISVDTKKKELVGPFRNGGRELRPASDPERVLMHDFVIPELGTSKWNKIEHRLFSAITMNWRGKPLVSHEAIVKLIARETAATPPDGQETCQVPGCDGRLIDHSRIIPQR